MTSDHLDRHGSLEAYRRVKRRLAELVDPDGALVLNGDDPVVDVLCRARRPPPPWSTATGRRWRAASAWSTSWIVAAAVPRLTLAGGGTAATGPGGRIMPVGELAIPGRHNVSQRAGRRSRSACCSGLAPDAIRRAAAGFTGVEHRLRAGRPDRRRPLRQRLAGHPAGCRHRRAPRVRAADRAHRRRPRQGRRPRAARPRSPGERVDAAVLIGESGPTLERLFRDARPGAHRTRAATLEEAVERADALARDALAGAPTDAGRRSCSARPPRASTCSRTTPPAVGRSRPRSRPSPSDDEEGADGQHHESAPPREAAAADPGRHPAEGGQRPARAPRARVRDPGRDRRAHRRRAS